MAAATATLPPPINEFLYKPYKKYSATIKRKKRLFIQAGIVPTSESSVITVLPVLKALSDEAPLKDAVVLPPDESGMLNDFVANNITPKGLGFCAKSVRNGREAEGVRGSYAQKNPKKPLNILLTARRQVANLNSIQAFVTITPPRYHGESYLKIDLLCAKTAPEIDNVGAYLVSFVMLFCRRIGISKIQLGAVHDRVGYYQRLGFKIISTTGGPLVHMEMDVPPIKPTNLVFEENENVGFTENYTPTTVLTEASTETATPAFFEEEPEHKNVTNTFGGTARIPNKNLIAAKTNSMNAFMRRRKTRFRRRGL